MSAPDQRPPLGGKIFAQRGGRETDFPECVCQNQGRMRRKAGGDDQGSEEGDRAAEATDTIPEAIGSIDSMSGHCFEFFASEMVLCENNVDAVLNAGLIIR